MNSRKTLSWVLALILMASVGFLPAARADGEYGYTLFTQNNYKDPEYATQTGLTLRDDGCDLFAVVHAVQWVNQCAYDDDLIRALLREHMPYPDTGEALNAYCEYASSHMGVSCMSLGDEGWKEGQTLRELFNSGYALIVNNMSGHILCAADYVICDAEDSVIRDDGATVPPGGSMYVFLSIPARRPPLTTRKGPSITERARSTTEKWSGRRIIPTEKATSRAPIGSGWTNCM